MCLGCLGRAFKGTEVTRAAVRRKARFWARQAGVEVNDRQCDVLNRRREGFTGRRTTTTWATLTNASHNPARRDTQALIDLSILKKDALRVATSMTSTSVLPSLGVSVSRHAASCGS